MAPNVKVPMNFGRHLIGSRSHSNLILKLKEGKELRTSSLILSFNSPVIDHLTTELEQTSLDMDDFEEPAVQSFILASYVGELEDINKDIFRDVNKMAHVFDVAWLVERCGEYFERLSKEVDDNHEELLYLFEEARFVLDSLKQRNFIEDIFRRINQINGKKRFVKKYLEDFDNLTTKQLDLMLELAGNDVQIVVQSLTSYLAEFPKGQDDIFTGNSRYLLENANLSFCRQNDRLLYENLFDILQGLENISNDHLKFILKLHRDSDQDKRRCLVDVSKPVHVSRTTKIPNLFHSFDQFKLLTFDELIARLADSVTVTNLMMFAEALFTWLMLQSNRVVTNALWSFEIMNRFVEIKKLRKWKSIPKQYFEIFVSVKKGINIRQNAINKFFEDFMNCDELFEVDDDKPGPQLMDCHNPSRVPCIMMFEQKNKFAFHFKHPDSPVCSRNGACGFIIKTTPLDSGNPDAFDMQLCIDHAEYPPEVHFHDELCADNMHVMVGGESGEYGLRGGWSWCTIPTTWSGKPYRLKYTAETRNVLKWAWGTTRYTDNIHHIRLRVMYEL